MQRGDHTLVVVKEVLQLHIVEFDADAVELHESWLHKGLLEGSSGSLETEILWIGNSRRSAGRIE